MRISASVGLALIGLALAGPALAAPAATEIRLAGQGASARLVIDVTEPVTFEVFALHGPDRIVIDIEGAVWRLDGAPASRPVGPVVGVRTGQFNGADARLVLDLAGPIAVREAFLLVPAGDAGYRIVVELGGSPGQTVAPSLAGSLPAAPQRTAASELPPLPRAKPRGSLTVVVIDAGHGGDDPGAIAAHGLYEKELTLAAARDLRDALIATGRYTVRLTRERDVFLSLAERVDIARRHGAELFISLHCDALDDPSVRGATIYTVSETASDAEATQFAEKENRSDILIGTDLVAASYDRETAEILIDLTRRDTMNASARFAELLGVEVGAVAKLRRNSHRFAGFRVLKAPDVPSVLFEMGYLSNPRDLAMLATPKDRRRLMRAAARAIDRYFERVTAYQSP